MREKSDKREIRQRCEEERKTPGGIKRLMAQNEDTKGSNSRI